MLDGGYAESLSASHANRLVLAEASESSEAPLGKRKLPDEFAAAEASGAVKARTKEDEKQEAEDSAASSAAAESSVSSAATQSKTVSSVPHSGAVRRAHHVVVLQTVIRMGMSHPVLLVVTRWMASQA